MDDDEYGMPLVGRRSGTGRRSAFRRRRALAHHRATNSWSGRSIGDGGSQLTILPTRFKCTECGCEVVIERLGFEECAWCHGEGPQV